MNKRTLCAALAVCMSAAVHAQLLINNVQVVDVEQQKIKPAQTVLVQDGKFSFIGKDVKFKLPATTQVVDGTGKYLVPGFTDAHVHFFQSGGLFARPDAIDLRSYMPYEKEIKWTQDNMEDLLRRYLATGITSVIDVGSTNNFLKLREKFTTAVTAPSIAITGPLLTTWVPDPFKNLGDNSSFVLMKDEAQVRQAVQEQLQLKADFIKIWYIVLDNNVEKGANAALPLVKAAIDEAHKSNKKIAVHATERITAQKAVEAGADFLVHNVDDEVVDATFLKLLKEKKTVLCPTMVVAGNYGKVLSHQYHFTAAELDGVNTQTAASILNFPWPDTVKGKLYMKNYSSPFAQKQQQHMDSVMQVNLKKMLDAGITIATGTDAGNTGTQHATSYISELKAMQQAGFTNWQLLQASTLNGAKALGLQQQTGSIAVNKMANAVLLNADPTASLDNWSQIAYVINKGALIKPDTLITPTPETLVQQQLNAYNAHNLDAFLTPYADDVELYDFPATLLMKGKEAMRKDYQFITQVPKLHCRLLGRIVQGNMVIDHEEVYGFGNKPVYAAAIYVIEKGKIKKVYFKQ